MSLGEMAEACHSIFRVRKPVYVFTALLLFFVCSNVRTLKVWEVMAKSNHVEIGRNRLFLWRVLQRLPPVVLLCLRLAANTTVIIKEWRLRFYNPR